MASYTVRMVLKDADWEEYNVLYIAMGNEGFTDIIKSDDGKKYKMPDGEYNITSSLTRSDIMEKAKRAAKKTGVKYAIFITESSGRTWYGLDKV